jgi:hypothetical protein
MEPSNGVDIEPPNLNDNNLAREEKPPATTTVPEPKPKLPEEMERWSREWLKVSCPLPTHYCLDPLPYFRCQIFDN